MTELRFDLQISMTSDWRIGSGKGQHRSIDSLVDKDADGLPHVSASTIRGIWRDAAQLLAGALDAGPPSTTVWWALVEAVFGSEPTQQDLAGPVVSAAPLHSLLRLDDASLSAGIRSRLIGNDTGRSALREALTFIRPGIEIDQFSGRTKTDYLRFEQLSRRGVVLSTSGAIDLGETQLPQRDCETIVAFLNGAAALVDRLGAKRRRGLGRCYWTVAFSGASLPSNGVAADVLEKALKNGGPPRNLAWRNPEPQTFADDTGKSAWTIYRLAIRVHAPIVVADEVQGNVITSQDSIPGTHLLGYVGRQLRTALPHFWQNLAADDVRVLPAYPDCNGDRGLPVPLVWSLPKNASDGTKLRLIAGGEGKFQYPMKPVRQGFVTGQNPMSWLPLTKKSFRTHNTVLDESQRPDEEVGGVYTYEAIAAGQVLHAEVWVRSAVARHDQLETNLTGSTTLGRARHAGYGRVSITASRQGSQVAPRNGEPSKLRLWLTSDAILNAAAAHGHDAIRALQEAIAETLAKKVEDLFVTDGSAANWVNARWRRIESWQGQWGLPRPTLMALEAGSVAELVLKPGMRVDADAALLAREGIGERRGEGYGAVHVDHPLLSCAPQHTVVGPTRPINGQLAPLTSDDVAVLKRIHRRAWEGWIAAAAETLLALPESRATILGWTVNRAGKARPPMSQIGGLRAAMGKLADEDELARLRSWVSHLASVPNREELWDKALGKLRALVDNSSDVWNHLAPDDEATLSERGLMPPPENWDGFDWRGDPQLQRLAVYCLLAQAARFHKRDLEAIQPSQPEVGQ